MLKIILNVNSTDLAQPLFKELDFLPLHHFCQNKFLCLLISIEHFVTLKKKRPCLEHSTTQPCKGQLTLQGHWMSSPHSLLAACALSPVS